MLLAPEALNAREEGRVSDSASWLTHIALVALLSVLSLQIGSRNSQGLMDSSASLIQFSSPARQRLGLREEEVGNANQIGLEVTPVIQLCPQTCPPFLRPVAVWGGGDQVWVVVVVWGFPWVGMVGLAAGPRQARQTL